MIDKSKWLHIGAAVALALGYGEAPALAQSAAPPPVVTPQAFLQLATPSSSGAELDVYRIPVITSTGAVVYRDVRIHFDVSAAGDLSLTSGYPIFSNSSALLAGNFLAGKYSLNGTFYDLSGPGVSLPARTNWSLDLESTSGGCLISAGWTTGAIAGHPLQTRLNAAKITYGGFAYGVLGRLVCTAGFGIPFGWNSGSLVGVAATANGLTVFRYTSNGGIDQSAPVDSISLQKCPATGAC